MADVILNLVDMSIFQELCLMPVQDILDEVENQKLRIKRPELNRGFHRDFEVDLEGDILEWSDSNSLLDLSKSIMHQDISLTPHIGAATKEAQDRIGTELAKQIIELLG